MAVYTSLTDAQIVDFLSPYDLGELVQAQGIAEGVENTNYKLTTQAENGVKRDIILTLYEKRVDVAELPFFVQLMQHIGGTGYACPLPIAPKTDDSALQVLAGKTALITSFLPGKSLSAKRIENTHLHALGKAVAELHVAAQDFPHQRKNNLCPAHLGPLYQQCAPRLDEIEPGLSPSLKKEIALFQEWETWDLPAGIIHADLFTDNVFFQKDQVSGVIDFYFACSDYLAYDLAIILNAWCFEPQHTEFNITKAQQLLKGYHAVRPLLQAELDALPLLARGAAVRFLLTRAYDWFHPAEGAMVTPKNPREYMKKWQFHQQIASYREYIL